MTQGDELIVIGGFSGETDELYYSSDIFKLKLNSGFLNIAHKFKEWTTMNVQLNTPRKDFVASLIPVQFN